MWSSGAAVINQTLSLFFSTTKVFTKNIAFCADNKIYVFVQSCAFINPVWHHLQNSSVKDNLNVTTTLQKCDFQKGVELKYVFLENSKAICGGIISWKYSNTVITCRSHIFKHICWIHAHYGDVIMSAMESQITSVSMVSSTVCSNADQRKRQSSASLGLVGGFTGELSSPKPVARKVFPFDDVIMIISSLVHLNVHLWLHWKYLQYTT